MATLETSCQYLEAVNETFGERIETLAPKEIAVWLEQLAYILLDRAEQSYISKEVIEATNAAYDALETKDLLTLMSTLVESAKQHV